MIGVVLAAGEATRMPNKLMLHTPNRTPLILEAIHYTMRHSDYVIVVTRKDTVVETYLKQLRYKLDIRFQTHPSGVVDAISIAESSDILVTFGDCYGYEWLPEVKPNSATVKNGSLDQMDGFGGRKWVARNRPRKQSFIGAFRCDHWYPSTNDLMFEFNDHGIEPQVVNTFIQDCGTPGGYERLWQR
jgi:hypothetical protein